MSVPKCDLKLKKEITKKNVTSKGSGSYLEKNTQSLGSTQSRRNLKISKLGPPRQLRYCPSDVFHSELGTSERHDPSLNPKSFPSNEKT